MLQVSSYLLSPRESRADTNYKPLLFSYFNRLTFANSIALVSALFLAVFYRTPPDFQFPVLCVYHLVTALHGLSCILVAQAIAILALGPVPEMGAV